MAAKKIITTFIFCIIGSSALAQESQDHVAPVSHKDFYEFSNQINIDEHIINLDEFVTLTKDPAVVIADLRDEAAYKHSHIKNAVHLGPDITTEKLSAIAPDINTKIILYCTNSLILSREISLTSVALPQIMYLGYKNIYILERAQDDKTIAKTLIFEKTEEAHAR